MRSETGTCFIAQRQPFFHRKLIFFLKMSLEIVPRDLKHLRSCLLCGLVKVELIFVILVDRITLKILYFTHSIFSRSQRCFFFFEEIREQSLFMAGGGGKGGGHKI